MDYPSSKTASSWSDLKIKVPMYQTKFNAEKTAKFSPVLSSFKISLPIPKQKQNAKIPSFCVWQFQNTDFIVIINMNWWNIIQNNPVQCSELEFEVKHKSLYKHWATPTCAHTPTTHLFNAFRVRKQLRLSLILVLHGQQHVALLQQHVPQLVEVTVAFDAQLIHTPRATCKVTAEKELKECSS